VLHPEIAWTPGCWPASGRRPGTARLQDPSILAIHFTGDGEGLVYYVMPFVEGDRSRSACGAAARNTGTKR